MYKKRRIGNTVYSVSMVGGAFYVVKCSIFASAGVNHIF